jgi:hypothetical protein
MVYVLADRFSVWDLSLRFAWWLTSLTFKKPDLSGSGCWPDREVGTQAVSSGRFNGCQMWVVWSKDQCCSGQVGGQQAVPRLRQLK